MTADLCPVPASRLAYGGWAGEKHRGEGDIHQSYSADRINEGKPIRTPFEHGGNLWCCVSITGRGIAVSGETELKAYRLTPERLFAGTVTTYGAKVAKDSGDAARSDPMGFYDGVRVTHGGKTFVLSGPPTVFVAGSEPERPDVRPEAQLNLFEP